eukprot:scaffold2874_cov384-Prasinococcus_capsulatus_cf.AAC.9
MTDVDELNVTVNIGPLVTLVPAPDDCMIQYVNMIHVVTFGEAVSQADRHCVQCAQRYLDRPSAGASLPDTLPATAP